METVNVDLVILGSGISGFSALMTAQDYSKKILLVTKGRLFDSGSTFRNINNRWGMTYGKSDREKAEILTKINFISRNTNVAQLSEILVDESYAAYLRMKDWGVHFLRDSSRDLRFSPCFLDIPVAAIIENTKQFARVLRRKIDRAQTTLLEEARAVKLLVQGSRCVGCILRTQDNEIQVNAKAVILATGGAAANYQNNIVEPGLTGDGYTMLQHIGLSLQNMEYTQRIWQVIKKGEGNIVFTPHILWSDAYEFHDYDGNKLERPSFSQVDTDSRATHTVIANICQDKVIDEFFLQYIAESAPPRGVKIYSKDTNTFLFEVFPFVQACNGGVVIGPNGETGIGNLYAAGEVTTGMHGGDRMGGMMITSAMVFGHRAAKAGAKL